MNFSQSSKSRLLVCDSLILFALIFTGCISSNSYTIIEKPPTPVPTNQIGIDREQLLRRREAQRLAAQAELVLSRPLDATFDLPLLLAREAVLTTWATDGYVTVEADNALQSVLLKAMAEANLAAVSQSFPNPPPFRVNHGAAATLAAAISPDGSVLAVATNEDVFGEVNSIRLWNMTSNGSLGKLEGVPAYFIINAMRFSPDGNTLLTVSPRLVILWDWRTSQQRVIIPQPEGLFYLTGNFAPDGRTIALTSDSGLMLVDAMTGERLRHFGSQLAPMIDVAFDPTGKRLLTAGQDDFIRLWDTMSGRQIATIGNQPFNYALVAFSPDGKLVAVSSRDVLQLWDVATRKLFYEFAEPGISPPSFSRDGKYLLVKASLLDLATGSVVRYFTNGAMNSIFQAVFADDGESVVAIDHFSTVAVWPTVDQMLLYADALIQRDPIMFTEWELRHFELGQAAVTREYQLLDAKLLAPFATAVIHPTPRPRPSGTTLSPLPTPTKVQ